MAQTLSGEGYVEDGGRLRAAAIPHLLLQESPVPTAEPFAGSTFDDALMERCLVDYIRSYARHYSRSESKILQRAREQIYQERDMGPMVARLERVAGPLSELRVLEIGAGSGSRAVAVALRGAEVDGLDPSEKGVEASRMRAQRYPDLRARFQTGVGEQLPFPDQSFDLVYSTEVLQHVRDLEKTFSEISRVLRPGSYTYHEAPNNLYPYEFHYRMAWLPLMPKRLGKLYARARAKDPRHLDDINLLYRRSIEAVMRRHGFAGFGDLYLEELPARVSRLESIRNPARRRLVRVSKSLGLLGPALFAVSTLGVYPQLRLYARKRSS